MGARGPIGKRPNERLGHQSREALNDGTKIEVTLPPVVRGVADPEWHPIAQEWFTSLSLSGQSVLYEPSDWMTAKYVAEAMSRNLDMGKFSAVLFAAVLSGMSSLLATEGDRRRLKIELQRATAIDNDEEAADATVRALQSRLAG